MSMKGETSEADAPEELGAEEESPTASSPGGREVEYCGWVYHLGVNSIGHEYCHLRYLFLRGRNVSMFTRDPAECPGIQPIRKGVISHTFMVEEMGRKKANNGELFVLRFYNRLDETKKGEIACATAGEARKWVEAFDQAKQQILYDLSVGSTRHKLSIETELNLEGHRPRVRRYAHGLRKIVQIGKGPEMLLRQTSTFASNVKTNTYHEGDVGDAKESHEWRCVRSGNGIRIFEDAADPKDGKGTVLKSVSVVDASLDTVFEVVLSLDKKRNEWDMVTGELELLESIDGHYDVVYGTHDVKHLTWGFSKKDFVFSRQWFRGQDGAYMILQFPAIHKNRPPRPGYQRTKINPSIWEIRKLNTLSSSTTRCVVTQIVEVHFSGWSSWKRRYSSNFEKTIPYALLCQVAGLKEFFEANPALRLDSPSRIVHLKISNDPGSQTDFEDSDVKDKFYDAIADDESSEDEDSGDDVELPKEAGKVKLRNVSWALAGLALKRSAALAENSEMDSSFPAVTIDLNQFHGSLNRSKSESDINCWSAPGGESFMIRGKTYLRDSSKVAGGDPLLKLLAVDWLKSKDIIDKIALHPNSLPQTEAGKKLPFILIINLQIPAKPNNSLVLYYATDRPIKKQSLLGKFVDGSDIFRDARFKLIPSVVEGYWMVKRAVGTKACLLAKALTCKYFRQDNFLEIDVDIGSSTVAKSIIGLVLGYVTSLVVDLAILIEAQEEKELPEYILGTVRLNRLRPDTAVEA